MKTHLSAALTVLGTVICAHSATIVNGSFEAINAAPSLTIGNSQLYSGGSTGITGWTTTQDGVERVNIGSAANDGSVIVDLAYYISSNSGGIQQTVATVPGDTFTLAFAASTTTGSGRLGTAKIVLMIDGVDVETYTLTNMSPSFAWETFTYDVTPTTASTVIEFQNRQNANLHFANIDNVRVVPEPSSMLLGLLGAMSLLRRRR